MEERVVKYVLEDREPINEIEVIFYIPTLHPPTNFIWAHNGKSESWVLKEMGIRLFQLFNFGIHETQKFPLW